MTFKPDKFTWKQIYFNISLCSKPQYENCFKNHGDQGELDGHIDSQQEYFIPNTLPYAANHVLPDDFCYNFGNFYVNFYNELCSVIKEKLSFNQKLLFQSIDDILALNIPCSSSMSDSPPPSSSP